VEDSYALKGIDPKKLTNSLAGQHFSETFRHGKYLFLNLSDHHTLLLHFGMTGYPKYFKNEEKKPDYTRLLLAFDNGYHLAYSCKRKLGEIRLVEDPDTLSATIIWDQTLLIQTWILTPFRRLLKDAAEW